MQIMLFNHVILCVKFLKMSMEVEYYVVIMRAFIWFVIQRDITTCDQTLYRQATPDSP